VAHPRQKRRCVDQLDLANNLRLSRWPLVYGQQGRRGTWAPALRTTGAALGACFVKLD
jgi:hypothetical protein